MNKLDTLAGLTAAILLHLVLGLSPAAAQVPAGRPGPVQGPQPPARVQAPPPLSPEHQRFVDQVLELWQQRSQEVQRYRCTFRRWEYDPVFGPRDTFKTYSEGAIKYEAPDKGLFKVEKVMELAGPTQAGAKPQYVQRPSDSGEYWICDGKSVYEYDHKNKQVKQLELPPQMQGKAIAEGPLPFLFGANAEQIKQRYWIIPQATPADVKAEYWLEAIPRQAGANFQKVRVIIDHADFLPKGLVIYDRNFDPASNPAKTTFTFENREVNWSIALQQLNIWHREFYDIKIPAGWKKVVEKYDLPAGEAYPPTAAAGRSGTSGG